MAFIRDPVRFWGCLGIIFVNALIWWGVIEAVSWFWKAANR